MVSSACPGVELGAMEEVKVGGVSATAMQESVICGSCPGLRNISRHTETVNVSSSVVQATAPSSIPTRTVSPLTSISTCEGMLRSDTE
jgi:hypothetical protein